MYRKIKDLGSRSHSDESERSADDGESFESESDINTVTEYDSPSSLQTTQNEASSNHSAKSNPSNSYFRSKDIPRKKLAIRTPSGSAPHKNKNTKRRKSDMIYTYETIIGIHLYRTSTLKFKKYIRRPRIKVSIYDVKNHCLAMKSDINRNVVINIEPDHVDSILPIISKEGRLNEDKTFSFVLDETLIINEDIEYLKNENVVIFFEILDTVVTNLRNRWKMKTSDGWHHICWAFFKPKLADDSYINKRRILQLYKYRTSKGNASIFEVWSDSKRKKYPATLEVSIKEVKYHLEQEELTRPHTALQKDKQVAGISNEKPNALLRNDEENFIITGTSGAGDGANSSVMLGSRAEKLLPLIRLRRLFRWRSKFECPAQELVRKQLDRRCLVCRFNENGTLLAYTAEDLVNNKAMATDIIIVQVPNLTQQYILQGHTSGVHCLRWMPATMSSVATPVGKQAILSTSEDHTCILWFLAAEGNYSFEVLPHFCPIYSAQFLHNTFVDGIVETDSNEILRVASGGRNGILHVWHISTIIAEAKKSKKNNAPTKMRMRNSQYEIHLRQELSKHDSDIVDMVYSGKFHRLYSGDVGGTVVEWCVQKEQKNGGHEGDFLWNHARSFRVRNGLRRLQIIDKTHSSYSSILYALTVSSGSTRKGDIVATLHKIDTKTGYESELFSRISSSALINTMAFDFVVVNHGSVDARFVLFTSDGNRIVCLNLKSDTEVETIAINARRTHMSGAINAKRTPVDCIKAIDIITSNSSNHYEKDLLAVVLSSHKQQQETYIFLYGSKNQHDNNIMAESTKDYPPSARKQIYDGKLGCSRNGSAAPPCSPNCKKISRLTSFFNEVLERCDRIIRYGSVNTGGYKLAPMDDSPPAKERSSNDDIDSDETSIRSDKTFRVDNISGNSDDSRERFGNTFSIDIEGEEDEGGDKNDNTFDIESRDRVQREDFKNPDDTDLSGDIEFLS